MENRAGDVAATPGVITQLAPESTLTWSVFSYVALTLANLHVVRIAAESQRALNEVKAVQVAIRLLTPQ